MTTIEEKNLLFALFDDKSVEISKSEHPYVIEYPEERVFVHHPERDIFRIKNGKYHISHDWIMPVWKKFLSIEFEDGYESYDHELKIQNLSFILAHKELSEFHEGLFNAIKEYQTNGWIK